MVLSSCESRVAAVEPKDEAAGGRCTDGRRKGQDGEIPFQGAIAKKGVTDVPHHEQPRAKGQHFEHRDKVVGRFLPLAFDDAEMPREAQEAVQAERRRRVRLKVDRGGVVADVVAARVLVSFIGADLFGGHFGSHDFAG